jgi:hypothetical protein
LVFDCFLGYSRDRQTPENMHCRGMVSEERLRAVFDKIIQDVEKNRPDCTDNKSSSRRSPWRGIGLVSFLIPVFGQSVNPVGKTNAKDAAGRWIIDPPFPGELEYLRDKEILRVIIS